MMGDEECRFEARGNSEQEVVDKMMAHMKDAHPDKMAEMNQMSDDNKKKMMMDMKEKVEDV
ncbi:MAG: hypothetical protein US70_C0002G0009 [Parcubacteria group bacterium GW2011_GWD2_38_11]|nr:MAG: hypothetical protein US70_C0002G0009 [Parcubacteria group bacterium GW2011_GWD2_38_11]